jgi:hypothetical protein
MKTARGSFEPFLARAFPTPGVLIHRAASLNLVRQGINSPGYEVLKPPAGLFMKENLQDLGPS